MYLCSGNQNQTLFEVNLDNRRHLGIAQASFLLWQANKFERALRSVCTIFEFLDNRRHLGIAQASLALRSVCTIFEFLDNRRHLGIAQASLALRSVCTIFDILGLEFDTNDHKLNTSMDINPSSAMKCTYRNSYRGFYGISCWTKQGSEARQYYVSEE